MESVTWSEAVAFCRKLTETEHQTGALPKDWHYDLPSEAQWEYACRAGTTSSFNNGEPATTDTAACPNLDPLGWYAANSGGVSHPVGQKPANAWGLRDMHGNVGEWGRSWFLASYWIRLVAETDRVSDPPGGDDINGARLRIVRGGGFDSPPRFCRSASPNKFGIDARSPAIGFRVILWQQD